MRSGGSAAKYQSCRVASIGPLPGWHPSWASPGWRGLGLGIRYAASFGETALTSAPKAVVAPSLAPRSFVALLVAEMQIAVITQWLSGRFALKTEPVATMLVANTRALVSVAWSR